MNEAAILAALRIENELRCNPSLDDEEVQTIARSAGRYEPQAAAPATVQCLADVQSAPVPWLCKMYLALGTLCMISGDPSAGKTFIALAIAASLSQGRNPFTNERCEPIHTLYLSHENSAQYVVRPRFDALGGNPKYLHILQGQITLQDTDALRSALLQTGSKLLIIDTLSSFLGANVDAHRSNETRPVLDGLIKLAEELGVCVLIIRHMAKSSGGRALYRGLGSIDFTAAVRIEFHAGTAPDDKTNRALVQVKNNLGAFAPSLAFAIEGKDHKARLVWKGTSTLTAADLAAPETQKRRTQVDDAVDYLREQLSSGPKPVTELMKGGGYNKNALDRASRCIGVVKTRQGESGPWVWSLRPRAKFAKEENQ